MQVLKLFRDSLINFNTTIRAINLKTRQRLAYMILLAAISSLPAFVQSIQLIEIISANGQAVSQAIPEFTIENGKLTSANQEPFIYETDFLIYAYDPKGEIDFNEVTSSNQFGIALETNPDNHLVSIVGQDFTFPHNELNNGFNQDDLSALVTDSTSAMWWVYPAMFIFLSLSGTIYIAILGVMIALFTSIIVAQKGLPMFFVERFNLALPAMTIPIIGVSLLALFGYIVPYQFEVIAVLSLIRLYSMIRHTKVITVNKKEDDQ